MLLIKKQRVRILRIMKFILTRMSTLINWALFEHNFNTIGNTKSAQTVTTQSLFETEKCFVHLQTKRPKKPLCIFLILIFVTFCEWSPEYPNVCIRHNLRAITWRSDTKPRHYIRIIILQASYHYSDCEILSATCTHIP